MTRCGADARLYRFAKYPKTKVLLRRARGYVRIRAAIQSCENLFDARRGTL